MTTFVTKDGEGNDLHDSFTLDLRPHFTPFNLPTLERVITQVKQFLPDDEGITVMPLRGRGLGVYKIFTTDKIPVNSSCGLHFMVQGLNRDDQGVERLEEEDAFIPLAPPPVRRPFISSDFNSAAGPSGVIPGADDGTGTGTGARIGRQEGTLITFLRCSQGPLKDLGHSEFDAAIRKYGAICKPTSDQKHRGLNTFNGNRFCVIEPSGNVPDSLDITHPDSLKVYKVAVRYRGQQWFCARCRAKHSGPCPELQAFYRQKDARKEEPITHKLVSDSTLRRVTEIGLCADVICMPGAGIGEVTNILRDDPDIASKKGVVMIAGANDILEDNSHQDFLFNVDKSVLKLKALSVTLKPKLTVVTPTLNEDLLTDLQRQRQLYLHHKLEQLTGGNLHLTKSPPVDLEDIVHPSPQGTENLVHHIQTVLAEPLVINTHHITGDRIYLENRPVYVYGCRTCNQVRGVSFGYCFQCREALTNFIPEEIDQDRGPNAFPPLHLKCSTMIGSYFPSRTYRQEGIQAGFLVAAGEGWVLNVNPIPPPPPENNLPVDASGQRLLNDVTMGDGTPDGSALPPSQGTYDLGRSLKRNLSDSDTSTVTDGDVHD